MIWQKDDAGITFYCDMPDCKSVLIYPDPLLSPAAASSGDDFIPCLADAKARLGWVSFKRVGRPWDYFCKGCAPNAETAHRRYSEQENERDRIKARNAH